MEEMEALLARLAPGHPSLDADTPRTESISVPWASLSPLSLVHLLMVSPFLSPSTEWHTMHAKADAMGITQWVTPFMEWMRATTVEPQQVITNLTSVDLANTMLAKSQGIWTSLVPPHTPPQPPSQGWPLQEPFQLPETPAPPPAPAKQAVTPAERWEEELSSLLRL